MFQPQIIERRRMELARAGTHSPRRGRGRRIKAVATVVLLAVVVGALAGFVAFRVTRDAPDRGLAADAARWQAQADALHARERLKQALERGRAADAARWQAQADAWVGSNGSRRRSVVVTAGGAQGRKPNQEPGTDLAARPVDASPAQQMLMQMLARKRNTYPAPARPSGAGGRTGPHQDPGQGASTFARRRRRTAAGPDRTARSAQDSLDAWRDRNDGGGGHDLAAASPVPPPGARLNPLVMGPPRPSSDPTAPAYALTWSKISPNGGLYSSGVTWPMSAVQTTLSMPGNGSRVSRNGLSS
jgi:hypothetical protein